MEPQTTVCIPSEQGMDIFAATQWLDMVQVAVAGALDVPNNSLHLISRRIGGGYGGKLSRPVQVSCACAIACFLTNRPVRFVMTIESNMTVAGKRVPCHGAYEVEIDDDGIIQRLKNVYDGEMGASMNDSPQFHAVQFFSNCYNDSTFDFETRAVLTNIPTTTWCRGPGSTESIAQIENIMEHIARETGRNPVDVRLANIRDDNKMKELLPEFLADCDYYKRYEEIEEFNISNRWRKRGIAVVPMQYHQGYFHANVVYVSVYHADGTVAISHGGSECGQGIHTKVAQVASHFLDVPLETVRIREIDNMHGANAGFTAGSFTSEAICFVSDKDTY